MLPNAHDGGTIKMRGGSVDFSGASGAIPVSDYRRRNEHAEVYYGAVRKMTADVETIAVNTGLSVQDMQKDGIL